MKIFKEIKDSIYSPSYYSGVRQQSFGEAMKYLLKVLCIPAMIFTIVAAVFLFSAVSNLRGDESVKGFLDYYPSELQVTIKSGQVSTNVAEPYIIPVPEEESSDKDDVKNIVVIDTSIEPDFEKFETYSTYLLVVKDYIIYREDSGKISVQSMKDFPDIVINRENISGLVDKLLKYLPLIVPLFSVVIFLFVILAYFVSNLFFVLIFSLITWIIQKIRKDSVAYLSMVKVGIHAVTLPMLLEMVFFLVGINLPIYVSILMFIIIVFINLKKETNIISTNLTSN